MIYKFERKLKGANQVDAEGEELTINNAGRKVQKFELSGRSEQETREGYNLLNVPSNFEITSSQNNRIVPISLKANTAYTINVDEVNTDNTTLSEILFRFRYNNQDVKYVPMLLRTKKVSFSATSDIDTVWIYSANNYNTSATTNTTFKNLMIYEGEEDRSYEEYGVSPSPDFPSEIKNVGKSYNLAYTDWAEEFVNIVNNQSKAKIKEENGITFLHYLASAGYPNYDKIYFFPQIEYKENTTYSFEFDLRGEAKYVENLCIEYTDGSSERLGMTNGANIWTHFRFSSNPNKTVKYLRPQYSTGSTDINVNTIQIIESPLFKPYNPYNQKQINIEINNDNSFDIDKIHRGYYDSSRYLKGLLSNDSCGQLFEIKHDTIIRIKNTSDSSWRAYCFVYDENMNKVENIWWGDTFKSGIESSKKIDYKNNMKYVSFSILDITGIYNPEIFRQSAEVGIYDGRVYSLDNLPKYQEHKGMEITFPLEQGQKLYEGSYLAEDGIHNIVNETTINILEVITLDKNKNVAGILYLKNKRKIVGDIAYGLCTKAKSSFSQAENTIFENPANFLIIGNKDDTLDTMKEKFNGATIQYKLDKEEIIPYTSEQQEIYNQLQNLELFRGCNHITVESNVKPAIKLSYYDGELDMTDYKYNLQFKKHMQEM